MRQRRNNLGNPVESAGRQSLTATNRLFYQLQRNCEINPFLSGTFREDYYSVWLEPGVGFEVRSSISRLVSFNCVDIIRRRALDNCFEYIPALLYIASTSGLGKVTVSIRENMEVVTLETSNSFRYVESGFPGFTLEFPLNGNN